MRSWRSGIAETPLASVALRALAPRPSQPHALADVVNYVFFILPAFKIRLTAIEACSSFGHRIQICRFYQSNITACMNMLVEAHPRTAGWSAVGLISRH
jgi:hypothetical protein